MTDHNKPEKSWISDFSVPFVLGPSRNSGPTVEVFIDPLLFSAIFINSSLIETLAGEVTELPG